MTSLARRRSRIARPLSWLVVAGLAGAALIGPGAGGVGAAGVSEPGAPDFVPNSGHTSSAGLSLTMGTGTMFCSGDSVNSLSGSFSFSGAGAGDHVVIYLAENNGSNATPAGNVQNNETTIELDGKTSPVSFTLDITSPFTVSKGGILLVFASTVSGTQTYSSKSNSLNCTESTTTTTSDQTTTTTSSGETTTTTSSGETTTTTSSGETTTTTSSGETTTTTSSGETTTTTSDQTTTDTTSTGTDSGVESTTTTNTTDTTSTGTDSGVEGTTTTNSSSSSSSGGVKGVTATPPATDTIATSTPAEGPNGLRIVLLGMAFILAMVLLLQPREVANRK